jgi:hypothetical protein
VLRQNAIRVKIGLIPTCERSSEGFPGRVGRFTAMHDDERVAACSTMGMLAHLYLHLPSILLEIPAHELGSQIITMMETTEPWYG